MVIASSNLVYVSELRRYVNPRCVTRITMKPPRTSLILRRNMGWRIKMLIRDPSKWSGARTFTLYHQFATEKDAHDWVKETFPTRSTSSSASNSKPREKSTNFGSAPISTLYGTPGLI